MDIRIKEYCILLVIITVEAQNSSTDLPLEESRRAKLIEGDVRLHSGYKPKPIHCISEGFQADPKDCGIFYRCMKSGKGKFTIFRFQCTPGTVYDPETEVCNYPQITKRLDCGGFSNKSPDIYDMNDIDEVQQELPVPITTKIPKYSKQITRDITESDYNTTKTPITIFNKNKQWNKGSSIAIPLLLTTSNYQTSQIFTFSPVTELYIDEKANYKSNICTAEGFMGDYENCHKFYRCVGNQIGGFTKYEFSCSESTIWDDDIKACNHIWAVKRNKCARTGIFAETTKILEILPEKHSNNNNYLDKHDKLHKVIQQQTQINDEAKISQSQTQITYGDRINKLNPPSHHNQIQINYGSEESQTQSLINYGNREVQTQKQIDHSKTSSQMQMIESTTKISTSGSLRDNQEQNTTQIDSKYFNKCTHSGFVGDPYNCKIFYRCVDNGKGEYTKYEFFCSDGTLWDQKLEACNHAWAVQECGGKYPSQVTKVPTNTTRTTKIYSTSTKVTEYKNTTTQSTNQNDKDIIYNNQNTLTTGSLPAITSSTAIILSNYSENIECRSSGFIGDIMNCKIFYRCVDNGRGGYVKHKFECGEGTVWDPEIESCNYEWGVHNCSDYRKTATKKDPEHEKSTEANERNDTSHTVQNSIKSNTTLETTQLTPTPTVYPNYTTEHENHFEGGHSSTNAISQEHNTQTYQTTSNYYICLSEGFHADPNDCKKFFRCVSNDKGRFTIYEFSCAEGTVWMQSIQSCDHANEITNCSQSNDYISEPLEDNQYYSTSSSVAFTISTAQFVPSSMVTSVTNDYKESISASSECTSEGFQGDKINCKKFYKCVDNGKGGYIKHNFTCGEGTAWDEDINGCNHINLVDRCRLSNTSTLETGTSEGFYTITAATTNSLELSSPEPIKNDSESNDNNCSEEGFFGNTSDCKKFYRCVDDGNDGYIKYEFTCGEGTIWDQDLSTCNYPQDVENPSCQSDTDENLTTNSSPATSFSTISSEYTDPKTSTTEATMSPELTTSQLTTQSLTNTNENGEKTQSNTQTVPSKQPSNNNYTCTEAGFFPNLHDCKKFYRCVDWDGNESKYSIYHFECGEGTIWDPALTTCNYEESVYPPRNCSGMQSQIENKDQKTSTTDAMMTPEPTTPQSLPNTTQISEQNTNTTQTVPSKQPTNNNYTCPKAGFFPDPYDCKKFYRCVDWDNNGSKYSIYYFECGEGTIWDPILITCNYEESVYPPRNCSDTQSQTENTDQKTSTTVAIMSPEQTTTQLITQQISTQQTTIPEQSTTQQFTQTTSEQTTTNQQPMTTTSQSSTFQDTTTQYSSTFKEPTIITESSSSTQTVTTEKLTSHQTTTDQPYTSEQTTTQQFSTTDKTTTYESTTLAHTTSEQTTSTQQPLTTTPQLTTIQETTTPYSTTSIAPLTITESTSSIQTTSTQISTESTSIENTTPQTTTEKSTQSTETVITTTNQSPMTELVDTTKSTTTEESVSSTTQSNNENISTEGNFGTTIEDINSASEDKCPETDEDQYLFACPTSFRRHPKYCNLFYQCTEDDTQDAKIAIFTCPNNTIYDESKVQCIEEDKAAKRCNGEIASRRRMKRLGIHYKDPIIVTSDSHLCTVIGHSPFEKNSECSPAFMKCEKSKSGKLRGFVYLCPQNYIYWSISRKCEHKERVKDCKRTINNWSGRWEIPIEKNNVAW